VNSGINPDEAMKLRLIDYYQITILVKRQIQAFIDKGEYEKFNLENTLQFKKSVL